MSEIAERRRRAKAMRSRTPTPSIREIADALGVSPGTIHRDINPDAHERYSSKARDYKRRQRRQGEE